MNQKNKDRLFAILVLLMLLTGSYLMMKADFKNKNTNEWIRYYR